MSTWKMLSAVLLSTMLDLPAFSADLPSPTFRVGDRIVTTSRQVPLKNGTKILRVLEVGKVMVVSEVRGNWIRVTVGSGDSAVRGWVHGKNLDYAASNLGRPANLARYPVLLRAVEGAQPGDPPQLYYDPRQVTDAIGAELPPPGNLISANHLMLYIKHCPADPRQTGKISGPESIMPMRSGVPMTIESLETGFYAVALMGELPGDDTAGPISNWGIFAVK